MNQYYQGNTNSAHPKRIGFIGCGKIGEPMIRSLVRQFPDSIISVSRRSKEVSTRLSLEFENVTIESNQSIIDRSDTVFLCLLAKVAKDELPELDFRHDQVVISVMADISLDEVAELIAPAENPCVTIPLPFIETGNCPLPVYPESRASETLFGAENEIITANDESAIGPHFAATVILSTTMCMLDTASQWLGQKTGDQIKSEIYVVSLLSGYLDAMDKDGKQRFAEALQDLSTEGGLNTQLLQHNREGGVFDQLRTGLDDLGRRVEAN